MKRGIKLCLALAGVLFVLGLTLNLVGAAMGGRRESNRYFQEHWEEIFHDENWGPALVGSDGVHIGGTNGIHVDSEGVNIGGEHGIHVGHHSEGGYTGKIQTLESGELTGITAVEVDVDCGDIWLQEGDAFGISLSWDLSNYAMSYRVENGILKVEDESWDGVKWGDDFAMECAAILTVPAGTALNGLDLSTEFGDIKVDAAITATEADLSTNMGDVVCRGLQAGELEAKSDMGDVTLHLPGGRDRYTWKMETKMGELTEDGEKRSGGLGDVTYRSGSGPSVVEAETAMGDVALHFTN